MDLEFGKFKIDERELLKRSYRCDPGLCKGGVCCAVFDIAVTFEEKDRIEKLIPKILKYCPWLETEADFFKLTPCELFIKKRENGLCIFNWQDEQDRCWCALHSAALEDGLNPFSLKPLNCSMWPFLRDGENRLELDTKTPAPCLKEKTDSVPDAELLAMLNMIKEL